MLAAGVLHAVLKNPWGWALFMVALVGAVLFSLIAMLLNLPVYVVIVNSALGGAWVAVAGSLMLVGRSPFRNSATA